MGQKDFEETSCKKFEPLTSVGVSLQQGIYVFDVVTNNESILAASLSNHAIKILDPEKLIATHCWTAHSKQIVGLKFSSQNGCHLFSSSVDGRICLWDLRQSLKTPSQCFQDLSCDKPKALNSFDINCTEKFLCGGTELIQEDAYILFWDTRSTKLLGGYWDTHNEDITQLKFHPSKKDSLISGSVDGLINLFDISKSTEEAALINTFNTMSSIYKLNWISGSEDKFSCITHTHDFKVWNISEMSPYISISRDEFSQIDNIKAPVDYLVDVLKSSPSNLELMSGSFNGSSYIWEISEKQCNVKTLLTKGHTDVVRTCHWNDKMQTVITGGEDGVICLWKKKEEPILLCESKKISSRVINRELRKFKPY